jgi:hypothetical protein
MLLRLHRAVLVDFSGPVQSIESFEALGGDANVRILRGRPVPPVDREVVLCVGSRDLPLAPEVDPHGNAMIADKDRTAIERGIESVANAAAVAHRYARQFRSPGPCVALEALDDHGAALLKRLKAIYAPLPGQGHSSPQPIDAQTVGALLTDRTDGVSLFAEHLSHEDGSAKLYDLVRLLERAFAAPYREVLDSLLLSFVHGSPHQYGYTAEELAVWVDTRDRAGHYDRRDSYATEAECRRLIPRIEQAVLDVLMNKVTWHDDSIARRSTWHPFAGSTDAHGGLFVTRRKPATIVSGMVDIFGCYPLDLDTLVKWPAGWFTRTSNVSIVPTFDVPGLASS